MISSVHHGILIALLAVFVKDANFASLPDDPNIAHGRQARDGEFPFQVALLLRTGGGGVTKHCGGAIISESVILTAAHCVEKPPSSFLVRAGVNDMSSSAGQDRSVQRIVAHPNYREGINDIALIKLSQPLQFNNKVNKIGLNSQKVQAGTTCTIIGWGDREPGNRVSETMLKTGTVTTQGQSNNPHVIKIAMRPGDDGVCSGDSGGPMVCNGRVAGVNSYINYERSQCPPDVAQAFASVDYYYNWINQNMP